MTRLCVPIFVESQEQARRGIALAGEAGADIVELRLDHFPDPVPVRNLIDDAGVPCIVTCRPTWEGGDCELSDEQRIYFLDDVNIDAAYTDVELKAGPEAIARFAGGLWGNERNGTIVSAHDFA
ncbi:MAG: type I 3-dehydroquinate dehydratase, partial [Planctomycetota bacterium]|nr:type I 3-dehydroquinate dehydratase [Planctomycetota bacterium]